MYKFKKLTINDRKAIQGFTSQFPPYSDFNFTSFYSYDTENDAEFYLDENTLIIKLRDYITNEPIFSFLAKSSSLELTNSLLDLSKTKYLKFIPEHSINSELLHSTNIKVEEDRDSFDYVLSINLVAALNGKKYEHQRWRVNQFKRYYPNHLLSITDCTDQVEQEKIINISTLWAKNKNKDATHEITAIKRMLKAAKNLNLINISLKIDNKLVGFAVIERLNANYAIGHFMKADKEIKGVFDMLFNQTAIFLKSINCALLNYEQDLGDENLRRAKIYWSPVAFLKKYILSSND